MNDTGECGLRFLAQIHRPSWPRRMTRDPKWGHNPPFGNYCSRLSLTNPRNGCRWIWSVRYLLYFGLEMQVLGENISGFTSRKLMVRFGLTGKVCITCVRLNLRHIHWKAPLPNTWSPDPHWGQRGALFHYGVQILVLETEVNISAVGQVVAISLPGGYSYRSWGEGWNPPDRPGFSCVSCLLTLLTLPSSFLQKISPNFAKLKIDSGNSFRCGPFFTDTGVKRGYTAQATSSIQA